MSELITDAIVEATAKAFANHEYRVSRPEMVPFCSCGWTATERYGVAEYDQHVARLILEAAAPAIAAKAWDEGYAMSERELDHAYGGHPISPDDPSDLCHECGTGNPYRADRIATRDV